MLKVNQCAWMLNRTNFSCLGFMLSVVVAIIMLYQYQCGVCLSSINNYHLSLTLQSQPITITKHKNAKVTGIKLLQLNYNFINLCIWLVKHSLSSMLMHLLLISWKKMCKMLKMAAWFQYLDSMNKTFTNCTLERTLGAILTKTFVLNLKFKLLTWPVWLTL
jgi:hypothetical protein